MDPKLILGILSSISVIVAFFFYFKEIFEQKTKPHIYTWIIWTITQGTATMAAIYGGSKFGSLGLIMMTILVASIAVLCITYGTKNITRSDTLILILALLAIVVWWKLDNPLLAVIMVSIIDGAGYIPTFRKTYEQPESESLSFWIAIQAANILAILAAHEYNLLTMTYIVMLTVLDAVMIGLVLRGRK